MGTDPLKTLLVLKTGFPVRMRASAYRSFARLGWRVAVMDQLVNQGLRVADIPIVCDLWDTQAAHESVVRRAGFPDGIMTFNESALVQASLLAERLSLPFLDPGTARCAIDKACQRQVLSEAGFLVPRWTVVSQAEELLPYLREWGRAVVKPADRAAGAGVRLIADAQDAENAFAEALGESHSGRVLTEEYVPGEEVSVESVAIDGRQRAICVTDKLVHEQDYFIEIGHTLPSRLSPEDAELVCSAALGACEAMNLRHGACHTEVKLTASGPVVIEVNPRLAGDCIVDLVDLAFGVDLYELTGRLSMGESPPPPKIDAGAAGAAAIRFRPNHGGTFLGASSALVREAPDWLVELSVTAEPGTEPAPAISNAGRIAYAIATAEEAGLNAQEAVDSLELEFSEVQS